MGPTEFSFIDVMIGCCLAIAVVFAIEYVRRSPRTSTAKSNSGQA
jgi:hypothetical protein